ncbi:flagellar biosynthesis regulator FlaF [Devosia sp. A449]
MQHHGALAYQQTTKTVETPREREAALLIKAAAGLQAIRDDWPADFGQMNRALTFNRKLWTIFMSAANGENSALPQQTRQNIVNLGLFVLNQTRDMLVEPNPQPQFLDGMININRQLAAGLRGN